jgi:lipopolysaccharide/colanic/teichoic acid biosynthesis glycosyltransferase
MRYRTSGKRLLDVDIALLAWGWLSPLFLWIILFIKLDSRGPAFFKQVRIGKDFKPFRLIKFRTMSAARSGQGLFDPGDASRITRVGHFLRQTKLDELPEIFNILNGDMSLVGPRPEVEQYVRTYRSDYELILSVAPGLSDFASIKYRNEEEALKKQADPKTYYLQVILPDKLRLAGDYIRQLSFKTDLWIIGHTVKRVLW